MGAGEIRAQDGISNAVAFQIVCRRHRRGGRQTAERRFRPALGVIEQLARRVAQCRPPVAPRERLQSARPTLYRGALRREITPPHRRRPHIREQQALEIGREPSGRDDEALLIQLACPRGHTARRHPPDIGVVGAHDAVATDLPLDLDGANEREIGEMAAARVRIVEQKQLTGQRREGTDRRHRVGQRAQVYRNVGRLRDHLAAGVEQRRRRVTPLADVR